jgi:hypothetical protein
MIELVIARYNENIEWIDKIYDMFDKITIYNKGTIVDNKKMELFKNNIDDLVKENKTFDYLYNLSDIKYDKINVVTLDNLGRETQTYLYHLINNYKNISDITVFSQGHPFDHSPDFIKLLKKIPKFENIQPLTLCYSQPSEYKKENIGADYVGSPPHIFIEESHKYWIDECKINVSYCTDDLTVVYPFVYQYYWTTFTFLPSLRKEYNFKNLRDFIINTLNIKIEKTDLIPFNDGAMFSVSKNVVLDNSLEFYENLMKCHLNCVKKNIDLGCLMERLWLSVFKYSKYNSKWIKLNKYDFIVRKIPIPIKDNIVYFKLFSYNDIIMTLNINNDPNIYTISLYARVISFSINNKPTITKKYNHFLFNKNLKNKFKFYFKKNILCLYVDDINYEIFTFKHNNSTIDSMIIDKTYVDIKFYN